MTAIPDAQLVERIIAALRSESQYTVTLPGDDRESIDRLRALGRQAGRKLGWKVRTFATGRDERTVIVAVTDSTPLHQELMRLRGEKAIRKAFASWHRGGPRGPAQ